MTGAWGTAADWRTRSSRCGAATLIAGFGLLKRTDGDEAPTIFRHPSESWGPLNHFSNGTFSGDASFRWHDDQMERGEGKKCEGIAQREWLLPCFPWVSQIT